MSDVTIRSLLDGADRPLLSYEFFPPKDDAGLDRLRATIEQLKGAKPDFVTCTYGAGGSTRHRTLEVCEMLRDMDFAPVMPHLTCVGSSREALREIADDIHDRGFRNIMTLRGDPPKGESEFVAHRDGLAHADDLVGLLKDQHEDFCCGVAGYPETHPEAASPEADISHLKAKEDAGAGFITTQLFYDNSVYIDFLQRCWDAGITCPILPGLLPAVSLKQVRRITSMCGSALPVELETRLEAAGGSGQAASDVGVEWVADQIRGLIANGAPAIHLYILNRSEAALAPAIVDCFEHLS